MQTDNFSEGERKNKEEGGSKKKDYCRERKKRVTTKKGGSKEKERLFWGLRNVTSLQSNIARGKGYNQNAALDGKMIAATILFCS